MVDREFADGCVLKYRALAFRAASDLRGGRPADEDEAQDALVGLWEAALDYDPAHPSGCSLLTWLYRGARYGVYHGRRRRDGYLGQKRLPAARLGPLPRLAAPHPGFAAVDDADEAEALLERMPPRWRKAAELRYYEGLTVAEVGRALGLGRNRASEILLALAK
jgi:RNA polymerase sigma factor (sigma-70 family)